jgi:hypothetical protein
MTRVETAEKSLLLAFFRRERPWNGGLYCATQIRTAVVLSLDILVQCTVLRQIYKIS